MDISDVAVRTATPDEVDLMADWAAAEGWNPGLGDAGAFRAADPAGFLVAVADAEVVGCASAVRYGNDFGFFGFFITRPDLRGRGIGHRVAEAAHTRLGGVLAGLDGVVAQQDTYRLMGYHLAHRNVRYTVDPAGIPTGSDAVTPLDPARHDVRALDRRCFPARRDTFLDAWLAPHDGRQAFVHVGDSGVDGYAVIRPCRSGWKVGPLFAESPPVADDLFRTCAAHAAASGHGGDVALDIPQVNPEAVALTTRYGMAPAFETARMYRGGTPSIDLDAVYGITTFELG